MVTIMTTEHYVLQGTRSSVLADMQQRASMYLMSVSSAIVALAFVGQIAKMGESFVIFGCVILPTLYVLGFVTYLRNVQQAIEDMLLSSGINRVRHWYTEVAPELEAHFVLSKNDDMTGIMHNMGVKANRWQSFLTTQTSMAFVNSVLLGALVGFVASTLLHLPILYCACECDCRLRREHELTSHDRPKNVGCCDSAARKSAFSDARIPRAQSSQV